MAEITTPLDNHAEDMPEHDSLQSLIAEILDAESRGEAVDREELIRQHSEHEKSLREFFTNHDSIKGGRDSEDVTLPPGASVIEDATLPPTAATGDDATLPPSGVQASSEAKVGDKIRYFGDYELLEEIARGGMGVVYKARQVNLNRIVALKMILSGQLAGEEDVKRFYTEAEAAANLDHPGIVPIFEIGEHGGQHYFSMGYIEGQSLAKKVADGPLPPREAAELVKKICEAMAYAHERGVIHRDLKPANILIDQNGQPKVTDFGLAKRMEADSNLTGTGQILGTPSYMAPEQASGKIDELGPLADVYALGAILYCLLTGRPPFQAPNPMEVLLQVLEQDPVPIRQLVPNTPRDLERIVTQCLRKAGHKRYCGADLLADDLERFLSDTPVNADADASPARWRAYRILLLYVLSVSWLPWVNVSCTGPNGTIRLEQSAIQMARNAGNYYRVNPGGFNPERKISAAEFMSTGGDMLTLSADRNRLMIIIFLTLICIGIVFSFWSGRRNLQGTQSASIGAFAALVLNNGFSMPFYRVATVWLWTVLASVWVAAACASWGPMRSQNAIAISLGASCLSLLLAGFQEFSLLAQASSLVAVAAFIGAALAAYRYEYPAKRHHFSENVWLKYLRQMPLSKWAIACGLSACLGAAFGYLGRPYFMGSYHDSFRSVSNGALVGVATPILILAFIRLVGEPKHT